MHCTREPPAAPFHALGEAPWPRLPLRSVADVSMPNGCQKSRAEKGLLS